MQRQRMPRGVELEENISEAQLLKTYDLKSSSSLDVLRTTNFVFSIHPVTYASGIRATCIVIKRSLLAAERNDAMSPLQAPGDLTQRVNLVLDPPPNPAPHLSASKRYRQGCLNPGL